MVALRSTVWTAFGLVLLAGGFGDGLLGSDRSQVERVSEADGVELAGFDGRLNRLERALLADAADGSLDGHSRLAAALVAGGADDPAIVRAGEERVARWVGELARAGASAAPPELRARHALEFMHRRVFPAGYQPESTDLAVAIERGRYNCLSATILYACLVEGLGLEVTAIERPGHILARVRWPGGTLDVETTRPEWHQRASAPSAESSEPAAKAAGGRAMDGEGGRASRALTPVQMVALVYYNRGVELLAQRRFAEALAANVKALRLDRSNTAARGNLLAVLNNWGIGLAAAGDYSAAAERLRTGLALDAGFAPFRLNYAHVHYQWATPLCQAGRYDEALKVLGRAAEDCPEEPYFVQAAAEVRRGWNRGPAASGD